MFELKKIEELCLMKNMKVCAFEKWHEDCGKYLPAEKL